ncbi:TlpA disulfide reductase family protein [Humibacter albus]|uniref:TlpA disulfide reductase family protein n=1 Tax=Humibacter albus TaxID=427754 RepID=UPI0003B728B5|nr:TlpA disulfide reductase family protein [Humibacter albus]
MRIVTGRRRVLAGLVAALAVGGLLSGCANDALAKQYTSGDDKNYIAGSGVTEVAPSKRADPVTFSGETEDGTTFSSKSALGDVLVVNFWYAGCPPCRAEASDLAKISSEYASKGVTFIGVNTRDDAATAKAYDARFKVGYPSILDVDGGAVQLAFSGSMRPNATPTTFVMDRKGRIAARIAGDIAVQPSTLTTLIDSSLDESK